MRTERFYRGHTGSFSKRHLTHKKDAEAEEADRGTGRAIRDKRRGNNMSVLDDNKPRSYSGALLAAVAISLLAGVGSLIWNYNLSGKLDTQKNELAEVREQDKKQASELRETNARLQVAREELGSSMGLTQKQMDARAQEIIRREEANAADNQRLASAQKQTAQQVSAVSSEVSNVKTDVGGVKNDLGKTQGELATAINQLTSMRGDMDGHSTLIARNHDELELLKHKGDRNYYEFTLTKGQKKPVGTVSLELNKADLKKNTFNLTVISDDKPVQKNNKGINEPLQFYSGKSPLLFEVVINSINSKNQISGYLTTPKNAPAPPNVP
jgi:F0F1-type ATP synthase membrane subunit b/b'